MNILMILSNPFMVDPRVYKEAKSLVAAGHSVTVIVWDRKKDYRSSDVVDGVRVVRIHNHGLMKVLPGDLFRNPCWWWKAFKKGLQLYRDGFHFDVVHCHDLDTLFAGICLKRKMKVKLVYDAHEIFAYMIARNMPKFIVNFAFKMEKKLINDVDQIITVNEPLKEYFKSFTDKPICIVMNCKDLISKEHQMIKNDIFTICYIGVIHKGRMFPELVDIIGNINNVRFVIAGKKEGLYEEVRKRCKLYGNIKFLGTLPFDKVVPKTLETDVIISIFEPNNKNNQVGLPNKVFEAMVCGRPIIVSKGIYSGIFVEKNKCGIAIEYTKEALIDAIVKLRDNPKLCNDLGKNAFYAAISKYNWNEQKVKLLKLYSEIL